MTTPSSTTASSSTDALEQRIERLEKQMYEVQSNFDVTFSPNCTRIANVLRTARLPGCALYKVPSDYYTHSLQWRAKLLNCTTDRLCKTVIFENLSLGNEGITNNLAAPLYQQKYVAIIVQYVSKVNLDTIAKYLASAGRDKSSPAPLTAVKLAMAPPDIIVPLTGFTFNGITPFGCTNLSVPLVIAKSILELPSPAYIWLGGGEVDVKLRIFLHPLVSVPGMANACLGGGTNSRSYRPAILDCTELRNPDELAQIEMEE